MPPTCENCGAELRRKTWEPGWYCPKCEPVEPTLEFTGATSAAKDGDAT